MSGSRYKDQQVMNQFSGVFSTYQQDLASQQDLNQNYDLQDTSHWVHRIPSNNMQNDYNSMLERSQNSVMLDSQKMMMGDQFRQMPTEFLPVARPAAKRRNRQKTSVLKEEEDLSEDDGEKEFSLDGMKTKFGRKVYKPSQYNPKSTLTTRKRAKKEDLSICVKCLKGHSQDGNKIVYCDGCNVGYHQYCYIPVIDDYMIANEELLWFCSRCEIHRNKFNLEAAATAIETGLDLEERRSYLISLPNTKLVELLLLCESHYSNLAIYPKNLKSILMAEKVLNVPLLQVKKLKGYDSDEQNSEDDRAAEEYDLDFAKQMNLHIPTYEELISNAILSKGPCTIEEIFYWIYKNHRFTQDFRAIAELQLQEGLKSQRFLKLGDKITLNEFYKSIKKRRPKLVDTRPEAGICFDGDLKFNLIDDESEPVIHALVAV